MKKAQYILTILLIVLSMQGCYAQKNQGSIDKIMKEHIENFKKSIDSENVELYVIMKYDFLDYKIGNTKFVEPTLDAQYLESKTSYLIQFTLKSDKLTAVNFKVINKNKKEIELINMLNGKVYEL